jgi:hypothetical protein
LVAASATCACRASLSEPLPVAPDALSTTVAVLTRGSSVRLEPK